MRIFSYQLIDLEKRKLILNCILLYRGMYDDFKDVLDGEVAKLSDRQSSMLTASVLKGSTTKDDSCADQ